MRAQDGDHAEVGARDRGLHALRAAPLPVRAARATSSASCAAHAVPARTTATSPSSAPASRARTASGSRSTCSTHWEADLRAKRRAADARAGERLARFRALIEQERSSPHRLADLAVDGDDLIELGYRPGPQLGRVSTISSTRSSSDPTRNDASTLLERAQGAARVMIRWDAPGRTRSSFTTRVGGVSEGPYASLNLGAHDRRRRRARRREPPLARVRRSAPMPSGSRSTGRCTRPSCTAPSPARAASTATASGRTSRTCRSSR